MMLMITIDALLLSFHEKAIVTSCLNKSARAQELTIFPSFPVDFCPANLRDYQSHQAEIIIVLKGLISGRSNVTTDQSLG